MTYRLVECDGFGQACRGSCEWPGCYASAPQELVDGEWHVSWDNRRFFCGRELLGHYCAEHAPMALERAERGGHD